jgi:hypothetical protein
MASFKRAFVLVLVAVLVPTMAAAQTPVTPKARRTTPSLHIRIPSRLPQLLPAKDHNVRYARSAQTANKPKRRVMGFAIAAGIGAGVGIAGLAATKFSENEGSCPRCFVEWSAIAIPVGAGVGAVVGYLIDRGRD